MEIIFITDMFQPADEENLHHKTGVFGNKLANWIAGKLVNHGYKPKVVQKEWGWQVLLENKPYELYIGCYNLWDGEELDAGFIKWKCFTKILETGIGSKLRKNIFSSEFEKKIGKLDFYLKNILFSEKRIKVISIEGDMSIH